MFALQYDAFAPPDVLTFREVPDPPASVGQVVVQMEAAGMNYADVYRREGRFSPPGPAPWMLGMEGAGTIIDLGPNGAASGFSLGDRVGWCDDPGSNAERVVVAIDKLIPLPSSIDSETAARVLLQGLTAHYLVHDSHPLKAGEWAVAHAAGGGVGLLLTQIIKILGGRVIALASSEEKQAAALEAGADHTSGYSSWVDQVRNTTGGGADVVFDSVGTTILDSLAAARVGGHAVFFGIAGGTPPSVEPLTLIERSVKLKGGDLWNVMTTPKIRRERSGQLFRWIEHGSLKVKRAGTFALREGAEAHRLTESRSAIGKIVITP